MAGKIDGVAVASIVGGTIFVYAGITGRSALATIKAIVSGKSPTTTGNANPIAGTGNPNATTSGSATISGTVTGTAIAQAATKYVGHAYKYGGAPGLNGTDPWDCSSFVNWVLSHDMHLPIPGGSWNPSNHGPATGSYSSYGKSIPRANVSAGDLCLWATHVGIALNGSQMISALNEKLGTQITGIENGGPQGEGLTIRMVPGTAANITGKT